MSHEKTYRLSIDDIVDDIIEEAEIKRAVKQETNERELFTRRKQTIPYFEEDEQAELGYSSTSCHNCKYGNIQSDNQCICKKHMNMEVVIESHKTSLYCAGHSEYNHVETRYGRNNKYVFHADDICQKCHRTTKELLTPRQLCKTCANLGRCGL